MIYFVFFLGELSQKVFIQIIGIMVIILASINPINWTDDSTNSKLEDHEGILLPNRFLLFKNTLTVSNHKGIIVVRQTKKYFT